MSLFTIETTDELQKIIKEQTSLIIRGGGSKAALSSPSDDVNLLDISQLSGIIEYQPSEYTFTAYAGTPLTEIVAALAEHGQYLPFDPILIDSGATIGGTVAANTSGSGRFRYGGVRDFILGIRFVDGHGNLVRSGGKVVKNAAGFDLSKFMVGSLGQFGALVELSFKVFPQPQNYQTLILNYPDAQSALAAIFALSTSPLEMDALDLEVDEQFRLLIRIGGLEGTLAKRLERLKLFLQEKAISKAISNVEAFDSDSILVGNHEAMRWQAINNLTWSADAKNIFKIPISARQMPELDSKLDSIGAKRRYSAAANVAWVALDDSNSLENILLECNCVALRLIGKFGKPIIGQQNGQAMMLRVKQALDPDGRFWSNFSR